MKTTNSLLSEFVNFEKNPVLPDKLIWKNDDEDVFIWKDGKEPNVPALLDIGPYWSEELEVAEFETLNQFEQHLIKWKDILGQQLEKYDYNTFSAFIHLYTSYRQSGQKFPDFLEEYEAEPSFDSMSCIGMSLVLLNELSMIDRKYGSMYGMVSCEEKIQIMEDEELRNQYMLNLNDKIKEHGLLCLKFYLVQEKRSGFVLLDPGYHISQPIIVMKDGLYPHTGWFNASNNSEVAKHYCYEIFNDYIMWTHRKSKIENAKEVLCQYVNLIYVKKRFIKFNVIEKRSHIYSHKCYVIRNCNGMVAGFYSSINKRNLVLFYLENGQRISHKFQINDIEKSEFKHHLFQVANFKKEGSIDENFNYFYKLIWNYRECLFNLKFCNELCDIDKYLEEY